MYLFFRRPLALPAVNLVNILRKAFTPLGPENNKQTLLT